MSTASTSIDRPRFARPFNLGVIAVVLVTVLAYTSAVRGPQLFDDAKAIQDNPSISRLWPITVPLHPPAGSAVSGRPVVNLSLALNHSLNELFGVDQRPDPDGRFKMVGFHLFNIAFHIMSGLLLLGIVRRTLRTGRLGERWSRHADVLALLVTAAWLLHPLQTDAVDYLIQRTELLVGLCYLATLYCSIRAWDAASTTARRRWFAAGVIACLLGMGSKEVMVSAPLMVELYDRAFRMTSWREYFTSPFRGRRWFYAALWATVLVLIALMATNPRGTSVGFDAGMQWYEYLHSQGWAIVRYLRLFVWPSGLSFDYGSQPVAHWQGVPGLILLAGIGVITILAWTRANRWGWLAFLGTWFLAILAPSSSVVPIVTEIAAERRMYLPLAAVLMLLVVAGDTAFTRLKALAPAAPDRPRRVAIAGGIVAVTVLLAALTFARGRLYTDPAAIWRDAAEHSPGNARAWYNLGVTNASLPVPRPEEADADYRVAVQLDSTDADALLRVVISDLGRGDHAEAVTMLHRYPLANGNDTILAGMEKALLAAHDSIGALLVLQRLAEAPTTAEPLVNLARFYMVAHRPELADTVFVRALEIDPQNAEAVAGLAEARRTGPKAQSPEPRAGREP